MMNTTVSFAIRRPLLGGTAASLLFHLLLVLPFVIHVARQPQAMPASVMVAFAPEFEVSIVRPERPPGVSQQRRVEAMSERETHALKEMPKVIEQESAEIKVAAAREVHKLKKRAKTEKKAHRQQQEEVGNSTITSLAAPPVQALQTRRTAAPLDSDAANVSRQRASWEALVKGKINKFRSYPQDARRRKRTGTVLIAFSVNAEGALVNQRLAATSGTLSLDRAAMQALASASPLPPPPQAMLKNGIHRVTLPVEFELSGRY